jgi:hypothetical protein
MIRLPGDCRVRRATVKNSQIAAQSAYYHGMVQRDEAVTSIGDATPWRSNLQRFLVVVIVIVIVVAFVVVRVDIAAAAAPASIVIVVVIIVAGARAVRERKPRSFPQQTHFLAPSL